MPKNMDYTEFIQKPHKQTTTTLINNSNEKPWETIESDFQSYLILAFKMYSFQQWQQSWGIQRNKKVWPICREKISTETFPEKSDTRLTRERLSINYFIYVLNLRRKYIKEANMRTISHHIENINRKKIIKRNKI